MNNPLKKIIICEDHQIVTDGLQSLINSFPEFKVIATVSNYNELYISLEKEPPDILLLDLNLPGKNGIEIMQEFKQESYTFKTLVLTMYNKKSVVNKVLNIGANGFLLKNCSSEDLYDALKHVSFENKFYYGEGVIKVKKDSHQIDDEFYKQIQLTPREKEIIKYLCDGNKVPYIATAMHISPLTVETNKKNIYRKLGVDSSVKLVTFVHENQLL